MSWFEIIVDIERVERIARGRGVRERFRLTREYGGTIPINGLRGKGLPMLGYQVVMRYVLKFIGMRQMESVR